MQMTRKSSPETCNPAPILCLGVAPQLLTLSPAPACYLLWKNLFLINFRLLLRLLHSCVCSSTQEPGTSPDVPTKPQYLLLSARLNAHQIFITVLWPALNLPARFPKLSSAIGHTDCSWPQYPAPPASNIIFPNSLLPILPACGNHHSVASTEFSI